MLKLFTAFRSLIYCIGFAFLWGWLALGMHRYDSEYHLTLPTDSSTLGIVVMILGGLVVLFCITSFVALGEGTPAPFDAPKKLVVGGLYRYVRNPMYLGACIVLLGFGLYHSSISMVLFSFLFLVIAHLFVLFVEEPLLENLFGESYLGYKRQVNRWILKLPHSS
jgi:protein-S-isoprenylcysteine O-methyltransferase Ste14